jgi:hypothetical protein
MGHFDAHWSGVGYECPVHWGQSLGHISEVQISQFKYLVVGKKLDTMRGVQQKSNEFDCSSGLKYGAKEHTLMPFQRCCL